MVVMFSSLHAQDKNSDSNLNISASPFYSHQRFSWSVAGNIQGQNPNIYSELIWKKVQRTGMLVDLNLNLKKRFFVQTEFCAGVTVAGKATDTDYQNDNRTNPVFHADLNSNEGSMYGASALLGYKIFETSTWSLIPYIGYGLQRELLYLSGDQGLNSAYSPQWYGPLLQVEQSISIKNGRLKIVCAYHQLKYSAKADWNLIEEFQHPVSFKHNAYGYRIETGAEFILPINASFNFLFKGTYFYSSTGNGIDELYYQSGDIVKTRLNDATLDGILAGLGIRWLL